MKRNKSLIIVALIAPLIILAAILYWYRGLSKPLTDQEIDQYIAKIEAQPQNPGGKHDLPALREFLEGDDGKPFYTVNLYKYYDQAQYLEGQPYQGSGAEAYDRFSQVMIRLLAKNGSHPIFGSDWADTNGTNWDRIVIVRYRSRRDIANVFASDEFAEASAHKWAALEENERMLVQGLHIPEFYIPVILSIILIELVCLSVYLNQKRKA